MGKFVVGIVVIFILHLAFILFLQSGIDLVELYQALNLTSRDVALVSKEMDVPQGTGPVPANDIDESRSAPKTVTSPPKSLRSDPKRTRAVNRIETAKKVDRRPYRFNESQTQFADTVIYVQRDAVVHEYQGDVVYTPVDNLAIPPTPNFEPIKKSTFTRIRSVARKPYDWARSFASKVF
jgi:hypothetical protein